MYPRLYGDMKRIIKIKTCIPILIKGAHPKNKLEIWNGIFHEGGVVVLALGAPQPFLHIRKFVVRWMVLLLDKQFAEPRKYWSFILFVSTRTSAWLQFENAPLNLTKESKYTNDRLLEIVISRHSESVPWRRRCPPFGPLGITRVRKVIPLLGDLGDDEDDVDHIPGVQCQMCIALSGHQLLSSTNSSINILASIQIFFYGHKDTK